MLLNLPKRDTEPILKPIGPGKKFIYTPSPRKTYKLTSYPFINIKVKPKYHVTNLVPNRLQIKLPEHKLHDNKIYNVKNDYKKDIFGIDNYVDNKYNINHSYYELGLKGHTKDEVLISHIQGSNKFKPKTIADSDDMGDFKDSREGFLRKFNERYSKIRRDTSSKIPVDTSGEIPVDTSTKKPIPTVKPITVEPAFVKEVPKIKEKVKKDFSKKYEKVSTKREVTIKDEVKSVVDDLLRKIDETDSIDEDDEDEDEKVKSTKKKKFL